MAKKIVNVKQHQRKVPSGGKTTVKKHTRKVSGKSSKDRLKEIDEKIKWYEKVMADKEISFDLQKQAFDESIRLEREKIKLNELSQKIEGLDKQIEKAEERYNKMLYNGSSNYLISKQGEKISYLERKKEKLEIEKKSY